MENTAQQLARRGRGRPSAGAGPAVTRTELLQVAARLIGQHGFAGTSVRTLAAEAGVSYGTVQHHFPTKDELWRALVDEVIVPELASRLTDDAADIPATVAGEIGLRIEHALTRPGLSAAVLTDPSGGARERLEYVAAATAESRRDNLLAMRALMDAGALRSMDPRSLAIAISIGLACISSAKTAIEVIYDVDLDESAQRDALTRDITDLLLHGLLPREHERSPS